MPKLTDFHIGQRFGKLVIMNEGQIGRRADGKTFRTWICLCDCGGKAVISTQVLVAGKKQVCGSCPKSAVKKEYTKADRAKRLLKRDLREKQQAQTRKLRQEALRNYFTQKESANVEVS